MTITPVKGNHVVVLKGVTQFGQDRMFPVNKTAELLAKLTGKKTFDVADVRVILELWYALETIGDEDLWKRQEQLYKP